MRVLIVILVLSTVGCTTYRPLGQDSEGVFISEEKFFLWSTVYHCEAKLNPSKVRAPQCRDAFMFKTEYK